MDKFLFAPWGSTRVTRKIDRETLRNKPFQYYRGTEFTVVSQIPQFGAELEPIGKRQTGPVRLTFSTGPDRFQL